MDDQQTCGKGLAEHSVIPAKMAELIDALAANLDAHMPSIDRSDENGQREHEAYARLHREFGQVARELHATARQMASYRDLPMARHHMEVMASSQVRESFETYVRVQKELLANLQAAVDRDGAMLAAMTEGSREG